MVPSSATGTFRLLDLPREIRDKIYRTVLCSFGPRPTTMDPPTDPDFVNELAIAEHSTETTILLTSKQIHREAYETMVKTSRFVRVTSSGGFPLRLLLNHLRVPVITENEDSVDNFKGYVLSVSLTCPKEVGSLFRNTPFSIEPCSLMLLACDMDVFCEILMDGDTYIPSFGSKIALKIGVAPGSILAPSPYKNSISDFFSETTQQVLLQPFRNRLRGFKKVKVRGLVCRSIAEAVEGELAQDTASNLEAVLSKYQDLKDEGQSLYRTKEIEAACSKWQDAALEIEQLRQSSSWNGLIENGGTPFVTRLAELYFLMKLNIAHITLADMEKGNQFAGHMAEDALKMALWSLKEDCWMQGFRWRPTDVHKAKLRYRHALFLRLEGDPRRIGTAISAIEDAHRLLPEDAAIARERELLLARRSSMG